MILQMNQSYQNIYKQITSNKLIMKYQAIQWVSKNADSCIHTN